MVQQQAASALKHVADNLKRELGGLIDDLLSSTEAAANGNVGENKLEEEESARIETLVSDLKALTVDCVEGRREFSGRAESRSTEATEKLVGVLKKEVEFLKIRLGRELSERAVLGRQISLLNEERKTLEEQSRRIESDINEASESNVKLEVAFGKTKRLVTNLRDSIDWANLVKKEKPASTSSASSLPPTQEESSSRGAEVDSIAPLAELSPAPAPAPSQGSLSPEANGSSAAEEDNAASPPLPLPSSFPEIVGAPPPVPMETFPAPMERLNSSDAPLPGNGEDAFAATLAPANIAPANTAPANMAPANMGPASMAPAEVAAAPAAAENDEDSPAIHIDQLDSATPAPEPAVVAPPELAAPQAAPVGMGFDSMDPFGGSASFEPAPFPETGGASESAAQADGSTDSGVEATEAAAQPQNATAFDSTDLFGIPSQPTSQPPPSEVGGNVFGFAPAASGVQMPQEQWQDMDLFEPIVIQAGQDPSGTPSTSNAGGNSATITTAATVAFGSDPWVDFNSPSPNQAPLNAQAAAEKTENEGGFDADLLSWDQPSTGVPGAPAEASSSGQVAAEGGADASTWAQFDSPPQFWNDLPPAPGAGALQMPSTDSDLLPPTSTSGQFAPPGNQIEVDFFGIQQEGGGLEPAQAPQQHQQQFTDFFEPQATPSSSGTDFGSSAWGEDPFQTQAPGAAGTPSSSAADAEKAAPPPGKGGKKLRRMSEIEIQKCDQAFAKLVGNTESSATKEELHKYYTMTGLPLNLFSKIWALTDPENTGKVSLQQFYLFMYFMTAAVKGADLPQQVTSEDLALILGSRATALAQQSPQAAQPAAGNSKLKQLLELGFEEGAAKNALAAAGDDVDQAANMLFGDSTSRGQTNFGAPAAAPTSSVASSPLSLDLVQISADISKVAARIFLQIKVLGPNGNALEQNNMIEIGLGDQSSRKGANFAMIQRTIKFESSFASLVQRQAKVSFEVKKEKKRSFVGKAWGLLDLQAMSDVISSQGGASATGNVVRVPLSSKPIDVAKHKSKKSVVKGSSSQLHLKFTW